jgi:hypothetical protein
MKMLFLSVALDKLAAYPSGHTARIDLQKKKFSELQSLFCKDLNYQPVVDEFKDKNDAVMKSLIGLKTELESLHRAWRDKYHI